MMKESKSAVKPKTGRTKKFQGSWMDTPQFFYVSTADDREIVKLKAPPGFGLRKSNSEDNMTLSVCLPDQTVYRSMKLQLDANGTNFPAAIKVIISLFLRI